MYTGAMTINLAHPWIQERSRAMHAELDATPPDEAAQRAVMARHLAKAKADRYVAEDDHDAHNDLLTGLYHAALPETSPDMRMHVGVSLMAPATGPEMTPEETAALFRQVVARPESP